MSREKQCRLIQKGRFIIILGVLCARDISAVFYAHRNMMKGEVAMHIIHGENGDVTHSHHSHTHTHTYEHEHEHVHTGDEENHEHEHEEGCCHGHDHDHDHGHDHDHSCCHEHGHDHGEGHCHDHHDHGHSHEGGCCCHNEQDETVAVLNYMLDHNVHHAAELESMAAELRRQGKTAAADMIDKGVVDFQTANMRLRVALSMLSEQA